MERVLYSCFFGMLVFAHGSSFLCLLLLFCIWALLVQTFYVGSLWSLGWGVAPPEKLCAKLLQSILNFSLKFPLVFSRHMDSIHFILKFTGSTGLQILIGNFFTSLMQTETDTYLWILPSLMARFLLTHPFSRAQPWGPQLCARLWLSD